jgi:hypothetical protein
MKAFKPLSFDIEISERPRYIPGSGPPMMPISLRPPDDKDWLIHSVVNWEGIPQYLVTPPDNPAYRVPVRKELILNWVSPRTYEDFEYLHAKKRDTEEWEQDNRILAEALQIKEKRLRILQAKNAAKSRSKLQRGITRTERNDSDAYSGDSDSDSEEVPANFPRTRVQNGPNKRMGLSDGHEVKKISSSLLIKGNTSKKGGDISNVNRELNPKRRKLSSSSQISVLGQPSLSRPRIKQEPVTSEEEFDNDDNSEAEEKGDNEEQHCQTKPSAERSSVSGPHTTTTEVCTSITTELSIYRFPSSTGGPV